MIRDAIKNLVRDTVYDPIEGLTPIPPIEEFWVEQVSRAVMVTPDDGSSYIFITI